MWVGWKGGEGVGEGASFPALLLSGCGLGMGLATLACPHPSLPPSPLNDLHRHLGGLGVGEIELGCTPGLLPPHIGGPGGWGLSLGGAAWLLLLAHPPPRPRPPAAAAGCVWLGQWRETQVAVKFFLPPNHEGWVPPLPPPGRAGGGISSSATPPLQQQRTTVSQKQLRQVASSLSKVGGLWCAPCGKGSGAVVWARCGRLWGMQGAGAVVWARKAVYAGKGDLCVWGGGM